VLGQPSRQIENCWIGRDTEANTITLLLDHCSEFALLELVKRDLYIYLPLVIRDFS
jgi:hypothetical protein